MNREGLGLFLCFVFQKLIQGNNESMKREYTKWSALWNCVKDKNNFLMKRNISFFKQKYIFLFLETYIFKISKNLIALTFFLPREILKRIDMPQPKLWPYPIVLANFQRYGLTDLLKWCRYRKVYASIFEILMIKKLRYLWK